MHLAIVSSRHFHDYELLKKVVDDYVMSVRLSLLSIVSGGSNALAERYARETNTLFVVFNANRSRYGRNATAIRNRLVAEKCTNVIAFVDSEGDLDILSKSRALDKRCVVITVKSSL